MKNDEKNYMKLRNLQQQVSKHIKIYYEHLLKLVNCLQMKAINVFLTTIFRTCLQPYLRLATIVMTRDTMIKHKEATMICEESGPIITKNNGFITQPKSKPITQPIVIYNTTWQ